MKTRYLFTFLVLGISLVGCSRPNEDEYNPIAKNLVFKASWENEKNTKTVLQENGTSIWWSTSEKINVFYGKTRSGVFTSTNTEPAEVTTFTGELILKDIVQEDATSAGYWAVYPYNENNTCDGESVTLSVPSNQSATEGTFADNFFPAIATSNNSSLSFYNVCGGIRFSVYNQGIISLIIKSNAEESLVGTVQVCFDGNGKPYVKNLTNGSSEVIVSSPEGGFVPGQYYFAAIIPQTLAGGLSITYVLSDGTKATYSLDKEIKVNRARFGRMDVKDSIVINPDLGDVTILSNEGTANCYIVSCEGEYAFDARVIGNGAKGIMHGFNFHTENPSISPETIELLWQDNEIISDLHLQSGFIVFSANSNKGNALIAAKDANDKVLWSWHIWATEQLKDIRLTEATHSYLDRNLGALSCEPGKETSNGLYYQWGRKDPLCGKYCSQSDKPSPLTIQYLIENPTLVPQESSDRWIQTSTGTPLVGLWGNPDGQSSVAAYKTIYDPCPIGYTIPADDAWYECGITGNPEHRYASLYDPSIELITNQGGVTLSKNGQSIFYPISAPLFQEPTSVGLYYRNSWSVNSGIASCAGFSNGEVAPNYGSTAESAFHVRCMREEEYSPFPPSVETKDPSSIRVKDVILNGKVLNNGNSPIIKVGFYWGSAQNNLNNRVEVDNNQSEFNFMLDGLSAHSTIYYRAFSENKYGIGYGSPQIVKLKTATEYSISVLDSLSRFMTCQYLYLQGMNGEGTIRHWYGDLTGNTMATPQTGWAPLYNLDYLTRGDSIYDYFPIFYYYRIINTVNDIVDNFLILADEGDVNIEHYKAELLGYRAYAYTMLVQLYCKSWETSNNGESSGLPLRIVASEDVTKISTLAEVYEQIYSDLDTAISLMANSSIQRADVNEIDLETIYAIYAKAALNRQDYSKAATYARLARNGHNLMSNGYYNGGFNSPNEEWIWGAHPENQGGDIQLYYYAYFAYMGYNSISSLTRTYPRSISKELFDRIPSADIRRRLFLDPLNYPFDTTSGKAYNELTSYAFRYVQESRGYDLYSTAKVYAYMQFKFAASFMPGGGQQNFIRAAEMVLIEAEADYFMGKENECKALLNYLNKESGRDLNYDCTKSGSSLLDELKFYRRLELWGEGFDWFDTKRWGEPISRKSFTEGGNFMNEFAGTWTASEKNDFVWTMPDNYEKYIRNRSTH